MKSLDVKQRIQAAKDLINNPLFEDENETYYYEPGTFSKIIGLLKGILPEQSSAIKILEHCRLDNQESPFGGSQ